MSPEKAKDLKVSKRNLEILEYRQAGFTLQEIGDYFGLTRERVRQIEKKVLDRASSSRQIREVFEKASDELGKQGFLTARTLRDWLRQISNLENIGETLCEVVLDELGERGFRVAEDRSMVFATRSHVRAFDAACTALFESKIRGEEVDSEDVAGAASRVKIGKMSLIECLPELRRGVAERFKALRKSSTCAALAERVLREEGRPLHWETVAERGNRIRHVLDRKPLSARSFGNCLSSNEKFTYQAQGTYGLREWGGDVPFIREALVEILREEGAPLTFGQLQVRLGERREVKRQTLVLYLSRHLDFYEARSGKYGLRRWLPERPTLQTDRDFVETLVSAGRLARREDEAG